MKDFKELDSMLCAGHAAQVERLTDPKNYEKPPFETNLFLLRKLFLGEVQEFNEEFIDRYHDIIVGKEKPNYIRIREELGDVCNYAHKMIEVCDKIIADNPEKS